MFGSVTLRRMRSTMFVRVHTLALRRRRLGISHLVRNQTRALSTNSPASPATSGAPTSSSSTAPSEEKGGIPWGLLIPLGIFGAIIGYFYRGNQNNKNEAAFRLTLRGELIMSPEELAQLRESNKLSCRVFSELCERAKSTFWTGKVKLKDFLDGFCVDQLGGEFQARKALKSRHVLERLEKSLGEEVDLDTAFLVLSLCVLAEPADLARHLFRLLKDGENVMSYDHFLEVVDKFERTNQLPVRSLVVTHDAYPLNTYSKATPPEIGRKAIEVLNPISKDKQMSTFVTERQKRPFNEDEFVELLLSNAVCAWGACWQRKT